ncbi:hypothetical protein D039_0148B, partial [Vibrio parahaemolyticus EKP-028]
CTYPRLALVKASPA